MSTACALPYTTHGVCGGEGGGGVGGQGIQNDSPATGVLGEPKLRASIASTIRAKGSAVPDLRVSLSLCCLNHVHHNNRHVSDLRKAAMLPHDPKQA
jgi:hypothetical protein